MRRPLAPLALIFMAACSQSDEITQEQAAVPQRVQPSPPTTEQTFALRCTGGVANATFASDLSVPTETQVTQRTLDFEVDPANKHVRTIGADRIEDVCSGCEIAIDKNQIRWSVEGAQTEDGITYQIKNDNDIDRRTGILTLNYKMVAKKGERTITMQAQGVLQCEKVASAASLPRSF